MLRGAMLRGSPLATRRRLHPPARHAEVSSVAERPVRRRTMGRSRGGLVKLANMQGRATLIDAHGGLDIHQATGGAFGPSLPDLYARWAEFRAIAPSLDGPRVPIDLEQLGPPSPSPHQVFGIGLNYRSHAEETGRDLPTVPATFTKYPTCLSGPVSDVVVSSPTIDWEVELVVVLGARAHQVNPSAAWEAVAGLTIGQDLSDRTLQAAAGNQFSLGKSRPGFGPTGPWVVTPEEFETPDDLPLTCSVNGEVVQQGRTADLVFDVANLVAFLSSVVTLLPGDLIFTGTPSGVGVARTPPRFLRSGDELVSSIGGIGELRQRFVDA